MPSTLPTPNQRSEDIMEDAWEAKAYDEYAKKHGNVESNLLAREQAMVDEFNGERMAEKMTSIFGGI